MNKKTLFSVVFSCAVAIFLFIFSPLNAVLAQNNLYGLDQSAEKIDAFKDRIGTGNNQYYSTFLQTKAGQIVGAALSFVGVIFLILMIYAGILWMTAQGNDQQIVRAKNMLINSIIGLIIIFAAYAITVFIGSEILSP